MRDKQTNQVDINLWVNEGFGDCSTAVTWVAISESANVSFSEQPQLLLLFRSKHFADVKALYCGQIFTKDEEEEENATTPTLLNKSSHGSEGVKSPPEWRHFPKCVGTFST